MPENSSFVAHETRFVERFSQANAFCVILVRAASKAGDPAQNYRRHNIASSILVPVGAPHVILGFMPRIHFATGVIV
jgi:hypothetical protein